MSGFFVTGSGTDIGKTYVMELLLRHGAAHGRKLRALKPVVSGFDPDAAATSDPGRLLAAMQRPITLQELDRIAPWRFAAALAPDMAAAREGRAIEFDALLTFCRRAVAESDASLLIEGVGGVMVPLDARHTVLDWMRALAMPVLLVGGSYLGGISHTLTAHSVLRGAGLTIAGIVVSESEESPVPLVETADAIGRFAAGTGILALPRGADAAHAAAAALAALVAC